ncbi:MAG: diacylglycerol kinase family lipid kinase [Akkermansiaceae bacterium]|nr:diacylglycerol kinase family lipid kinase [Akkermansiaceae bacterium]
MEQPHRYPVIFNPKARSQKGAKVLRFFMKHANRFAVFPTTRAGEASVLAARFAAEGEPVVIAAGGDGTLNEVVSGLAGSKTLLGVLPAGTMNVFAREMGIPFHSLEEAFQVIERGFVQDVDLFAANGAPFVQMAGVGFDAMVIEETTWESKKKLGPLAYLLAGFKLLGEDPPKLEVVCADGRREEGVAILAGNGSLYGGQFKFFRNANNHDSKLDVLVYKEAGYKLVIDSLRGLACGGIDLMESTSYFQTESFTVKADRDVPVQVDGELIGRFPEVHFKETNHRLRVLAPEEPLIGNFSDMLKSFLHWPRPAVEFQTNRSQ